MHAADIAEELGISAILIPCSPGNLSALGLIVSDVRHDDVRSWMRALRVIDTNLLEKEFAVMEKNAFFSLEEEGFGPQGICFQRSLDLRYKGQAFELNIPVQKGDSLNGIAERFHQRFQEAYGHRHPERNVELVNFRLSSFGAVSKPLLPSTDLGRTSLEQAKKEERSIFFQGQLWDTPVYERSFLPCDATLNGPAIVEESGATTVVPPNWVARADSYNNLRLNRRLSE